jgi:uncharacterized protein
LTVYFVDTNSVAKRYIPESGSSWVLSWITPTSGVITIIAQTTLVEFFSILERLHRENKITRPNIATLQNYFLSHAAQEYLVTSIDDDLIEEARQLVIKHGPLGLRTLDAIQLASALRAVNITGETITFVTADTKLFNSAEAEGFSVENPLTHP